MRILASLTLAALCLCCTLSAHADTLLSFSSSSNFNGTGFSPVSGSVIVPSTLTPTSTGSGSGAVFFTLTGLTFNINGPTTPGSLTVAYFAVPNITQLSYGATSGPSTCTQWSAFQNCAVLALAGSIFTGPTTAPVLVLDSYTGAFGGADRLQITQAPAITATPEPSSFFLLGTGLLGVAGAVRKRFA